MTTKKRRHHELSPAARRWAITMVLLRATGTVVLLVAVYYLAPLDRPLDTSTVIGFLLGLVVLGAVIAWQVRAVVESDTPRLRAIEAAASGLPLLLLLFASTYVLISHAQPDSFSETLGPTDALYFTVTVFATVGFGDIVALTEAARIVTLIQMLLGLVAVGVVAKLLLGAVQVAVQRRDGAVVRPAQSPDGADASRPGGADHGGGSS